MKNAFVVFVVALCALFEFGNEARNQDLGGLKLNQSIFLLTREPGQAGTVLEIVNAVNHTDGQQAHLSIGRDSFQSTNDVLFLPTVDRFSSSRGRIQLNGISIERTYSSNV